MKPRPRRRSPGVSAYRRRLAEARAARAAYAREHYAAPPGHLTTADALRLYNSLAPEYNLPPLANTRSFAVRCQQVPAIVPHRRPRYYGGNCYTPEHVRTLLESNAAGHARRRRGWVRALPTTHSRANARHMSTPAALDFYNSLAPAAGVRTLSNTRYLTGLLLRFNIAPARIVGHSFYWTRAAIRTAIRHAADAARSHWRAISRAHRRRRTARARDAAQQARQTAAARRREQMEEKRAAEAIRREQEEKRAAARAAQRAEAAARRREQEESRAAARAARRDEAATRRRAREEKQAAARRYPIAPAALLASGKLLTPSQFATLARCSVTLVRTLAEEGTFLAYHHPQRLRPILIHAPHAAAVLLERANQNQQP